MKGEQDQRDLTRVRIPAEFNATLDRFFSALKLRVLEAAVREADKNGESVVRTMHLATTAPEILGKAVSGLLAEFAPHEAMHVRRAS